MGLCLDIAGGGNVVGTPIVQARVTTAFRSAVTPGTKCIDVASALDWEILWTQLDACHGGNNQKWELRHC